MPITTRTTTKATHRTALTFTAPIGHRADKGRAFYLEIWDMIQQAGDPGRLIIDFGVGCGIGNAAFEQTQTVPQRDIKYE